MGSVANRIEQAGGPPPGVESSAIKLMFDASSGTAVVLQEYPTAQAMEDAAKIFDAMDTSDTPGTPRLRGRLRAEARDVGLSGA